MWVTATKDELREFLRDRLTPTFEGGRPVKDRMAEPTLAGFAFDGMPFYAGCSGSKERLQSKPIRWLFCDEVRNYESNSVFRRILGHAQQRNALDRLENRPRAVSSVTFHLGYANVSPAAR
jgi:hypothetical protein